jgi:hypothetical protein
MACNSSTSLKNQRPQPETRIPASVIVVSMPSSSLSTDLSDRPISKRPASLTPTPNARSGRRTRKNLGTETRLRTCSLPQGQQRTRMRTKKQLLRVFAQLMSLLVLDEYLLAFTLWFSTVVKSGEPKISPSQRITSSNGTGRSQFRLISLPPFVLGYMHRSNSNPC